MLIAVTDEQARAVLGALRRAAYRVPPLDPAYAADGQLPPWYHPVA